MSTVKKNTIANYIGQGYVIILGILILPLYLQYLGAESYGLIGFYTVLQTWLLMLDMGLSPTFARQISYIRGQSKSDNRQLWQLLRNFEVLFIATSIFILLSIIGMSSYIVDEWLNLQTLSKPDVIYCVSIMGAIIALRLISTLYKSGIQGFEKQVRLNFVNVVIVSFRYIGAWGVLIWVSQDIVVFFTYQLIIGIVELLILLISFYTIIPKKYENIKIFSLNDLKPIWPFTSKIIYATILWVVVTQTDKLVLSHTLPLNDFGYFSLIIIITNGMLAISNPVSQALTPRMTFLISKGEIDLMVVLYRRATRVFLAIIFPVSGILILYPNEILYVWTGDIKAAQWVGNVLAWYVAAYVLLSIGSFQYYLQYAYGELRLHVLNITISALIQIPIFIYSAYYYGVIGVGISWFVLRLIFFFIWPAIVHHHFSPGLHKKWLFKDVLPIFLSTILILMAFSMFVSNLATMPRLHILAYLSAIVISSVIINMIFATMSYNTKSITIHAGR